MRACLSFDFFRHLSYFIALAGTVLLAVGGLYFTRQSSVEDG